MKLHIPWWMRERERPFSERAQVVGVHDHPITVHARIISRGAVDPECKVAFKARK